ncbi:ribonuclease Z [Halorubraceae archaeon YAN]|nr:ribonuclease Z [Halorubraceae archaeon YAN]
MSLRVTFLGTSGAVPTTERAPSAILINREGDRLLFDCGEGTQRQMMRYSTGFTVSHIFVTHLHGDHILGIPGLIQSWDFHERDDTLTIHTPPGTSRHIEQLTRLGGHQPGFPIRINEVHPNETAVRMEEYEVRVFETNHHTKSQGYALIEDDRPGRFDREKAENELNIPPGPAYGQLHRGETVTLDDGRVIDPEEIVGDPRPGRKIVYTGDTRPTESTVDIAQHADLLIHDATFADDNAIRARKTGHATGFEAGNIAQRADVTRLALTHISSRYGGYPDPILDGATDAFLGEVFIASDGQKLEIPFPDDDQ